MKKILTLFLLLSGAVFASDNIYVEALEEFNSLTPDETFKVRVVEDGQMGGIFLIENDVLTCKFKKVKAPTRAKQDAKIYFTLINYKDNKGLHDFRGNYTARYAKSVVNKKELKKKSPKIAKKTATTVGSFFVKGLSYGVSFAEGFKDNDENNRLKSGAKRMYDDSFLSLVEYGKDIVILKGDKFYLVTREEEE